MNRVWNHILKVSTIVVSGGCLAATGCNLTDPWASAASTAINTAAALLAETLFNLAVPG